MYKLWIETILKLASKVVFAGKFLLSSIHVILFLVIVDFKDVGSLAGPISNSHIKFTCLLDSQAMTWDTRGYVCLVFHAHGVKFLS